jgi:hypothetical protein
MSWFYPQQKSLRNDLQAILREAPILAVTEFTVIKFALLKAWIFSETVIFFGGVGLNPHKGPLQVP